MPRLRSAVGLIDAREHLARRRQWTGIASREIGNKLRVRSDSDNDLALIDGKREQLEGLIQERYGLAKDQVRKDVDAWLNSQP
jgi:hypothetical protein